MYPILPKLSQLDHLDIARLSGAGLVDLDAIELNELTVFLHDAAKDIDIYVQAASLQAEQAVKLLDSGALALIVNEKVAVELVEAGIPSERLVVRASSDATARGIVNGGGLGGVIIDSSSSDLKALTNMATDKVSSSGSLTAVYVEQLGDKPIDFEELGEAIAILDSEQLTLDPAAEPSKVSVAAVVAAKMRSDRPDKLFLTVVVSESGKALGTCFSSAESIKEALRTQTGVYQSRKRGLWYKGATSGATQKLLQISLDCDCDALVFRVEQKAPGFCHNNTHSCFGGLKGLEKLEETVLERKASAPAGSYTHRLFTEADLLPAKILEEASELVEAQSPSEVAWEAADLLYFATVKLAQSGVSWKDVEANLDLKSLKVSRRTGNAKPKWASLIAEKNAVGKPSENEKPQPVPQQRTIPKETADLNAPIKMQVVEGASQVEVAAALRRPAQSSNAFDLARPIVEDVRVRGDAALLDLTAKFDRVQLDSPVLRAPFPESAMQLSQELKDAIDLAISNVEKFHAAQLTKPITVETTKGVVCSRFSRPIARVGLYVPGGSAVLPSTAIMLGVPAKVAGCRDIVFASPPAKDGSVTPEVVYVAHKVGASMIVLAGGAQAVAAMAYGTDSVTKCDKILGPGNQFVTAAKMLVSTDLDAQVSIDMPAGPSEVLVVADKRANKAYVVSDLLSQAEHGPDSQVVLIAVDWTATDVEELQAELDRQARALPRFEIIRKSIAHSTILLVKDIDEAMDLSNQYAPEHLILQVDNASSLLPKVDNAGSVFVGALSPESCGDYTSGTNHTLPTYGYANQYSGVNTGTFLKYITAQELTPEGIRNIGPATYALATREGLDGHAYAIKVRMDNEL